MKKYITSPNVLLIITILICIGTIFSLFSTFSDFSFYIFFSSDTLYLPSIFKDLFIDHNSLKGWHLNPSPNIFPDMIVYFAIMAITSNFITASFVFAIVQYLFFIYLINSLFKVIDLPKHQLITALSNLLLLLFFMVSFYSNDFNFTFYLISNSYHTGAFLMSLLCTILAIKYLKNKKTSILVYLGLITFLCVFSDRLFIVLFSIPWLLISIFYLQIEYKKNLIWINSINILSLIMGLSAFNFLKNSKYVFIDNPHRIMDYKFINECFKLLMKQMYDYLDDWNFKSSILIISIITFISVLAFVIKRVIKEKYLEVKTLYYIFSIFFSIIVFLAPVINGNYTGYDTFRYNIYVFYLLIINSGILISFLINKINILPSKIISGLIIILILGASFNIFYQFNYKGLKGYFTFYPKNVECIDKISRKEKLYCGLGNYWLAKYTTMFSKNGVKIYTSDNPLEPNFHVMNENWFKNERFNFILLNNNQETSINKLFNNDTKVIKLENITLVLTPEFGFNHCSNKMEIMK